MKKTTITQTALALLTAGFLGTAVAAGDEKDFMKLDTNEDGYISAQEAAEYEQLHQSWEATDANQDGQIDAAEFSAFESAASGSSASE